MGRSVKPLVWGGLLLLLLAVIGVALAFPAARTQFIDLLSSRESWRSIGLQIVLPIGANIALIGGLTWLSLRGRDRTDHVIGGRRILYLKPGAFWIGSISCVALTALFIWAALTMTHPPLQGLAAVFAALFLYILIWILRARVTYDDYELAVIGWTLRPVKHRWAEITRVHYAQDALEYHLFFDSGRRARVSSVFSGLDDLIATAWSHLPKADPFFDDLGED